MKPMTENIHTNLTRRRFLQTGLTAVLAGGAFPNIVSASIFGRHKRPRPGNRITIGSIGLGPQGRHLLRLFLDQTDAQMIAVCDVFDGHREQGREMINKRYKDNGCAVYDDFQKLLQRDDLDAVVIATPDHWHVPVALAAVKAGKDVYVEKPLGLALAEDQLLRKWVQKKERVFQFGTQQRSNDTFRRACELVRNGRLGKLQEIYVWAPASNRGGSTAPIPAPPGLDYDFWLGPAPLTPYTENKCFGEATKKTWWFNSDYALGFIAGWGIHPLDIAYWGHPQMMGGRMSIEGRAVFPTEGACDTAISWNIRFGFADGVAMNFRSSDGDPARHEVMNDLSDLRKRFGNISDSHGTVFVGSEGWVLVDRAKILSFPENILKEQIGPNEINLPHSANHVQNFVAAIKTRGQTICPIEEAVRADSLTHLADIAGRLDRRLSFDPAPEKFLKDDEANCRLALRPMRKPWRL